MWDNLTSWYASIVCSLWTIHYDVMDIKKNKFVDVLVFVDPLEKLHTIFCALVINEATGKQPSSNDSPRTQSSTQPMSLEIPSGQQTDTPYNQ